MPHPSPKIATLFLVGLIVFGWNVAAQDDASLYYRRTHGGAWPPSIWVGSDHSEEDAEVSPAPALVPTKNSVPTAVLDHGVNAADLGKGDWIWQVPTCISALGVGSVQGLIDYQKSRGMQWITVKCGDGGNIWSQFNTDLITRAHAAGLKIFGWAYVYGNNVQGEINVALNALALGADGFIIDAEGEYEALANNSLVASNYCAAIKAAYPNRFLAHAPFPIISSHSRFPYIMFGKFCDAVMPQTYWADIGGVNGTNYAVTMVARMNTEWRNWQNSLTGANTNAIKPIVPIGQGYNSVNGTVTGTQISAFVSALKTNASPATAGGYRGVSFWSCQHHTADMWNAIGAIQIGTQISSPTIVTNPMHRALDAGANLTLSVGVTGACPRFQWRFNGGDIPLATNRTFVRLNAQPIHRGHYDVVVTNAFGARTSAVARVIVNATSVWQTAFVDGFDTDSRTSWNVFQGAGDGVPDYTAEWAFDYGTNRYVAFGATNFIPPAPNSSGSSRGLKLTVNKNDLTGAVSGISLYPRNQSFSGNFILRCDVWLNYNGPSGGSAGSTEFATFGINHAATRVNWGGGTASASDGLWFAMDGEGGTTGDFRAYEGRVTGAPAWLSFLNSGLEANGAQSGDSLDPFFQNLFPGATYESAGAPGKRWVQCEVSQTDGMLLWRLNGTIVAERTNTTTFTNGNVMLGYMDLFTSIPDPSNETFVLFDNVRVLTPVEPPNIVTHPVGGVVNAGADTSLNVTTSGSLPQSFQWRFNGTGIAGATNRVLMLSNVTESLAGNYSLLASNAAGIAVSSGALLSVTRLRLTGLAVTNGRGMISFSGAPQTAYWVESSSNLSVWTEFATVTNGTGLMHVPISATNFPYRFFRIRASR